MDKAIFIPLIIWAIFAIVTGLKNTLSPASRLVTVISFLVYGFIFKDDIISLIHMKKIPYKDLLKNTIDYVFLSLAILWPAALIVTQKMTESETSAILVRLAIFSAAIFAGYLFLN